MSEQTKQISSSPITRENPVLEHAPRFDPNNMYASTTTHEQWMIDHPDQLTTPTGLQSRIQLAELFRLQHRRTDAQLLARGVLRDDDGNPRAHAILGTIAVQDKQYATATEHFQHALEAKPDQQGAALFLQTPKENIIKDIRELEEITERTDDQERHLTLLRTALDYKRHAHHTKEDDRLGEEARQFILTARRAEDPYKILGASRETQAAKLFTELHSWLRTRHTEPVDRELYTGVSNMLRSTLGTRADAVLATADTQRAISSVARYVTTHQSSRYQIQDQAGYYRALFDAYSRITNQTESRQAIAPPVAPADLLTEEHIPEVLLQSVIPDILKVQYDTVSGSEVRNNRNGRFIIVEAPLSLDNDDIYHVDTPDPQLSRAENVFAELIRHTTPDESQKEYLLARNPEAIPPVIQIAKRDQAGRPEITTIIFKNLESYNQLLQLITEQKTSEILDRIKEGTTPRAGGQELDELEMAFNHDLTETLAPPISVTATPIKDGEIVADEASAQRQTLLEKSFPEFPPDNVYFVLSDWITPDQQNVMKLTIGGKIFRPQHNPDAREFYTLDAIFSQKQEKDVKLLLGDLLQGGTIAANQLRAILERQPDIQTNDIPEFSINNILEPKNHAKAHGVNWFWMEPAHLLLNDVLRHFPEIVPETQDDPERWEDRLERRQQKTLEIIRNRTGKALRGKKNIAHANWVDRLVATAPDLTIVKAPTRELEEVTS